MKLNNDCVRDCLLVCEEISMGSRPDLQYFFEQTKLKKYTQEDITYSMKKLYEAGFIEFQVINIYGGPAFTGKFLDITWSGHQFIADIRSDTVWKKTKEKVASTVGSTSLKVMGSLASSIALKLTGL